MTNDQKSLAAYRIEQASSTLKAAQSERAAGRFADAINRAYYAMFYAGLAPLASRGVGTSKHTGVVSKVSELFVKDGPLPLRLGRALRQAFDLRQKSDCTAFFSPSQEQTDQIIAWAEEFVQQSRRVLGPL